MEKRGDELIQYREGEWNEQMRYEWRNHYFSNETAIKFDINFGEISSLGILNTNNY